MTSTNPIDKIIDYARDLHNMGRATPGSVYDWAMLEDDILHLNRSAQFELCAHCSNLDEPAYMIIMDMIPDRIIDQLSYSD